MGCVDRTKLGGRSAARDQKGVFSMARQRGQTQNSHNTFQSAVGSVLVRYGRKDDEEARSAEWEKMRCM